MQSPTGDSSARRLVSWRSVGHARVAMKRGTMPLHDERDPDHRPIPRSTVQVSWRASGNLPMPVAVRRGIDHCRRGEWDEGLQYLLEADSSDDDQTLPGLYFSYLGHALARSD